MSVKLIIAFLVSLINNPDAERTGYVGSIREIAD
ncbi:MAG: hypothetical protein Pg6C_13030 [Treponemataceae bacterium]|nr:MAG: hypothetical protein Pg6C_13030 [Treponemataceae bacterium]